jgi:CRP/FNR family cyclic AMP-dependent transcriptional regulator
MDIKQALGIASRQGWLPKTPAAFRQAVLERCLLQQAAAGDVICRVGDPPGGLFSLVAGGLGVVISRQEKAPCVTHFARPGTWFGEACAITGGPRRVGLVATRATTLLHLPLGRLLEIIAHDPAAWR